MERDTVLTIKCKRGKGKNKVTKVEYFRVLTIFEKYYNKWYVSLDDRKNGIQTIQKVNIELRQE